MRFQDSFIHEDLVQRPHEAEEGPHVHNEPLAALPNVALRSAYTTYPMQAFKPPTTPFFHPIQGPLMHGTTDVEYFKDLYLFFNARSIPVALESRTPKTAAPAAPIPKHLHLRPPLGAKGLAGRAATTTKRSLGATAATSPAAFPDNSGHSCRIKRLRPPQHAHYMQDIAKAAQKF